MDFTANSGIWGTMFGVPCVVADNFLKLATGDQLKVLLYILRCSGRICSGEEIALNTGVSIQTAEDAVLFWQQVNVLSTGVHTLVQTDTQPVQSSDFFEVPKQIQETAEPEEEKIKIAPRQKQNLTPSEISEMLGESADIADLFKISEAALGTLNHTMQNSLIWMYNYLGLKKEVIITLIYYCIQIEKTNSGYIEKIACNWAENDINSLNAAQDEVQRLSQHNDFAGKIVKIFEMIRRPTPKQNEFIEQWKNAGYSLELIEYAYQKTIEQINKLSFDYINKILLTWQENGYTTVKNVRDAENSYKKTKKTPVRSGESTSSDVDKYKVVINKF